MKQQTLDIWSCSVVTTIKHLEAPVATVVKETNGSQSPLKLKSVDQISGSTAKKLLEMSRAALLSLFTWLE